MAKSSIRSVLLRTAATRLQRLADSFLRLAESAEKPDVMPVHEAQPPQQPRVGGPPAHWVERVREAAPHLLDADPADIRRVPTPGLRANVMQPDSANAAPKIANEALPLSKRQVAHQNATPPSKKPGIVQPAYAETSTQQPASEPEPAARLVERSNQATPRQPEYAPVVASPRLLISPPKWSWPSRPRTEHLPVYQSSAPKAPARRIPDAAVVATKVEHFAAPDDSLQAPVKPSPLPPAYGPQPQSPAPIVYYTAPVPPDKTPQAQVIYRAQRAAREKPQPTYAAFNKASRRQEPEIEQREHQPKQNPAHLPSGFPQYARHESRDEPDALPAVAKTPDTVPPRYLTFASSGKTQATYPTFAENVWPALPDPQPAYVEDRQRAQARQRRLDQEQKGL